MTTRETGKPSIILHRTVLFYPISFILYFRVSLRDGAILIPKTVSLWCVDYRLCKTPMSLKEIGCLFHVERENNLPESITTVGQPEKFLAFENNFSAQYSPSGIFLSNRDVPVSWTSLFLVTPMNHSKAIEELLLLLLKFNNFFHFNLNIDISHFKPSTRPALFISLLCNHIS